MTESHPEHTTRVPAGLLAANAGGAIAASVFAAFGLARPTYVERSSSSSSVVTFWATCSAIRTWAVTMPLLRTLTHGVDPSPQLLTAAGLIQLGDSALGVRKRDPAMAAAPATMAVIHLVTAQMIYRAQGTTRTVRGT